MKKLKLESLAVETFEPSRLESAVRGTVGAHGWTRVQDHTCGAVMSCYDACITVYDDTCDCP